MRILVLCTYPINEPAHGGQLRVRNIVEAYFDDLHDVEVVGVLGSELYNSEKGFVSFPRIESLAQILSNPSLMEDYVISQLSSKDEIMYAELVRMITEPPDVIHAEQPWLFPFAIRYKSEFAPLAKIIYGSQNIEYMLKGQILASYLDRESAKKRVDLVKEVEIFAINNADAILCVSQKDVDWVKKYSKVPVVLAPNGVKPWRVTGQGNSESARITKNFNYALYCASGHPPNVTGFFEIFGNGFGSLKPDERLVVAGSAGGAIAADTRIHQSPKLAEKINVAGLVSQQCLESLLDRAQCIVLPLTQGGGTNLKTAEALWSGKHIVATSVAMRGFEKFIGTSGVHLADDSRSFKRALRNAMESPPLQLSENERDERRSVLWQSCLEPLSGLLTSLNSEVLA
jgi:glycosyltransferase involved in cell wall biosynthesis